MATAGTRDFDGSAMQFHEVANDRKAESQAGPQFCVGIGRLPESVKDVGQEVRRYTDAGVCNLNEGVIAVGS